ncbi:MAG: DUF3310 domain-containing protein [Desulfurellales bacterium]|nr:MAG: DUF3310 domain-containing protein [Desulfurellales bacterium]
MSIVGMSMKDLLEKIIADEKREEEKAELIKKYGVEIEPTMAPQPPDMVNQPPHYRAGDTYETIRVIEAWNLGFNLGNAVKYISRWQMKGGVEDLKKARWYLDREISRREGCDG